MLPIETTPHTQRFFEGAAEGKLLIQRCAPHGHTYFYPRPFCPICYSADVQWTEASGRATLLSYIIVRRPAPGYKEISPIIAVVELAEGPRMLTNIIDVEPIPERLVLDSDLQVAFQTRGELSVPVFRLLEATA